MERFEQLQQAVEYLKHRVNDPPEIGLILGSGLSSVLDSVEDEQRFQFEEIPHYPASTVPGHSGEVLIGRLEGKRVMIQRGRVHYYEGYPMDRVVFPVRTMRLLGVETLIITNAAGAINTDYRVGDFVLIRDHINMFGDNPLRGENLDALGSRFPDMTDAYDPDLRRLAIQAGEELELRLREGVYVAAPGPMYETPAEIQAYQAMGADLVGMSTVPEVLAARHGGIRVLGISCLTNMAAGIAETLTHEEVIEVTERRGEALGKLLRGILRVL
ncbi:MAG: purine-nucleoside phosphorylase [Candidatus Bipolaricaulia bacterium]